MKYGALAAASVFAVLFTACTSVKSPESADFTALRQDLESCRNSSLLEIPPKMVVVTPELTLPDQIKCTSGAGAGSTYCTKIPGIKYPAIQEDVNAEARAQVFSACLMVKRYSEQDIRASASNKLGVRPTNDIDLPSTQLAATSFDVLVGADGSPKAPAGSKSLDSQRFRPWQGVKDCEFCPRMVQVPSGTFKMGSPVAGKEQPVHSVKLRSFLLGKYEVTQAEWLAVMGNNPSANKSCGRQCPVDRVSWSSAQEFVKRLNERTGLNFRLPTEAEWEYAAQAGRGHMAPPDEEVQMLKNFAWYSANSGGEVHPVGQKIPNAFGLHDMQGNVWEWVEDVHHENYQGASPVGQARLIGSEQDKRVLRGGSYFDNPKLLRTTHRNADTPDAAYVFFGLRVARDLDASTLQADQGEPKKQNLQ
ncbi:formylglycine-generating enzyme family protein [Paucibacter sp. AS339]|uniref:formylglycine-generating enzyme family protein n=1 Tax=Paucibacter hankyongi TaxID=3133434 RepID=UPI0030B5F7FE